MAVTIQEDEPLADHTVFRIGGPARFLITAKGGDDLIAVLRAARVAALPRLILGAGSNVLVSDRGFPGIVIRPAGGTVAASGNLLRADAAVPMARVAADALRAGLRGFEWAIGVPGTIGGSVRGNAGCFGSEMKDVVRAITVFNTEVGTIEEWSAEAAEFGYRESVFKRRPELVILAATLGLAPGDPAEGQRQIQEYARARTTQFLEAAGRDFFSPSGRIGSQEVGVPTAGSTFKNVLWSRRGVDKERLIERFPQFRAFADKPGLPAGFLIDEVGLRGRSVGRAMVSRKHANFIINTGGATAEEVIMVIGLIKEHVHRCYGLLLEEEIQYVGFEDSVAER